MKIRLTVTCESCGCVQALERRAEGPERRYVICHGCEGVLMVTLTPADILRVEQTMRRRVTA